MSAGLSIVIAHWNARSLLENCLNSLLTNRPACPLEVIVVDNGSTDGSAQLVRQKFPAVVLVQNEVNQGYTVASNQGIKVSSFKYVLLLNSDTLVPQGALDHLVSYLETHRDVAIVGCRLRLANGSTQHSCFKFFSLGNRLLHALGVHHLLPDQVGKARVVYLDYDSEHDVDWLMGTCMLVRRTAIDQVGLLDERSFMGGGDQDWCMRFRRSGWRVAYTPHAEVIHYHGKSSFDYEGDDAEEHRVRFAVEELRSSYYFFLTYFGSRSATAYLLIAKTGALLRLLWWLIALPISGSSFRHKRSYAKGLLRILAHPLRQHYAAPEKA